MNTRLVPVDQKIIQFLLGAAPHPATGLWFGDKIGKAEFWWRSDLRAAAPPQPEPTDHLAAPDSRERAIIAAAVALVPFLEMGWDECDEPDDQALANAACNRLIAAVKGTTNAAPAQDDSEHTSLPIGNPAPAAAPLLNEHGKPYVDLPDFDSLAAAPNARTILDNLPHINDAAAIEILEGLAGQSAPAPDPRFEDELLKPQTVLKTAAPERRVAQRRDDSKVEHRYQSRSPYQQRRIARKDRRQNAAGQVDALRDNPDARAESPVPAAPASTLPLLGTYAWAQGVVDAEGYAGWMVIGCSSGGGLCLHESKRILVDELHDQNPFMFLHEIAHIRHVGHDAHWADYFTRLCLQYVGPVINERDAQAALAQVQLDRAEFAALKAKLALAKEAIRATAGLRRIAETERDQYKDKLAKYERAKMPPKPERLTMTRELAAGGVATETMVAAHKYDQLRDYAVAQTVSLATARASERERCAKVADQYPLSAIDGRNMAQAIRALKDAP